MKYDIDDIDRVTRADEGTLSAGSITSRTRDQQWTLDHVGNWDRNKLDLDGDGLFTGTDELDEVRTGNAVNELTARDIDNDSTDDYSLTYDAVGNLTDDGEEYEYVWDGFGRLRKIQDTSDQSLIAEYKYNGLGYLTAVHEDTDDDGDVDGDDKWFYRMYDERWRWIGTFRESDSDPKEEYIPHQAGADGRGGSSYIDLVILRDRDGDNSEWTDAADGTMEERIYYCQNWRADVSAIVDDSGVMVEWVKYSAYGVPFGLPRGDTDSDGDCDQTDRDNIDGWSSGYDVRYDVNLDGGIDGDDEAGATTTYLGISEISTVASTIGQSGANMTSVIYYSRNRWRKPTLGRWSSRDGMGFADSTNLYEFANTRPVVLTDPLGLYSVPPGSGCDKYDGLEEKFKWSEGEYYYKKCGPGCYKKCKQVTYYMMDVACVCNKTPDADFSNCMRGCLQAAFERSGGVGVSKDIYTDCGGYCQGYAGPPSDDEEAGIVKAMMACRNSVKIEEECQTFRYFPGGGDGPSVWLPTTPWIVTGPPAGGGPPPATTPAPGPIGPGSGGGPGPGPTTPGPGAPNTKAPETLSDAGFQKPFPMSRDWWSAGFSYIGGWYDSVTCCGPRLSGGW